MSLLDHAITWHVYPLGFCGAPLRPTDEEREQRHGAGLAGLQDWLDYAVDLGTNVLQLGPIFASMSHGYDTIDHYRVDPRLGTATDLDNLIAAAHDKGVSIVLDGVFNHVSDHHPSYRAALAGGPESHEARFFRIDFDAEGGPRPADFEGHGDLVALNHEAPEVVEMVRDIMVYWLDRGVAGWRLDAAYAVPTDFWAAVLPQVRERHGAAIIEAEVIHGDYTAFAAASGVDAVTQYELWKAVRSGIAERNFFEIDHALTRHGTFLDGVQTAAADPACPVPPGGTLMTFLGNHDVTRLATSIEDERHHSHATALLFTVGGSPSVYYGDELAFRGVKEERRGGDDEVRPAYPATPTELEGLGADTLRVHQRLMSVRRRHPWLVRSRTTTEILTNTELAYRTWAAPRDGDDTENDGGGVLLVALSIGDEELRVGTKGLRGDILEASGARLDGSTLVVDPHGWAIVA